MRDSAVRASSQAVGGSTNRDGPCLAMRGREAQVPFDRGDDDLLEELRFEICGRAVHAQLEKWDDFGVDEIDAQVALIRVALDAEEHVRSTVQPDHPAVAFR